MRVIGGQIMTDDGPTYGAVHLDENGRVAGIEEGMDAEVDEEGLVIPRPVNAHTHLADHAARDEIEAEGLSVEEAVAPPDGLKHQFLREAAEEELVSSLRSGLREAAQGGVRRVIDFREQGPDGARWIRRAAEDVDVEVTVLGRPSQPEAWKEEADDLVGLVDGIGISGMADQPREITDAQAAWCQEHDKHLALHLSEAERESTTNALDLEPDLLVHATECEREDLKRIADADVPVVACPRSNDLFDRRSPIGSMLDVGLEVALGTDNAMFFTPDVLGEAAFVAREYGDVLAKEILQMACRDPLADRGPGVREGDRVGFFDTSNGLRDAIVEQQVSFPGRDRDDD